MTACSWVHHPAPGQTCGTWEQTGTHATQHSTARLKTGWTETKPADATTHSTPPGSWAASMWCQLCWVAVCLLAPRGCVVTGPKRSNCSNTWSQALAAGALQHAHLVSGSSGGCAGAPAAAAASQSCACSASQGSTSASSPSVRRILPDLRCLCVCAHGGWRGNAVALS